MNKKLLFGAMALAALTACTTDDFESQKVAQQEASPIQFEVINNNDAFTRASMDGNKIVWSAEDGDLFTLYHGGTGVTGYENATYKAGAAEGSPAVLTTPSMIKAGDAVMVWPVDTAFRIGPADKLSIVIPADQSADIENNIPYMSDQISIAAYKKYSETPDLPTYPDGTAYNSAGKDRKYPIFMRPMASQLIVKADYAGTDATLEALYSGDDRIDPIEVTSVELLTQTGGTTLFTKEIPVKFTAPTPAISTQWKDVAHNAWKNVTDFDITSIAAAGRTDKLTTKCLDGNDGCKFLLLPQATIAGGVAQAAVVVNTLYGKVVVAPKGVQGSQYATTPVDESADAWYRFISADSKAKGAGVGYDATETPAATAGSDGKFKTTSAVANGMMQTINGFSAYKATKDVAKGEPVGAAATRYVKVLLTHLDMSNLHIESDKQLRDAAKVWKQMGLTDVTVYLDGGKKGDAKGEFTISQTTIDKINEINASIPGGAKSFKVMPCTVAGEACNTIVITGGGNVKDLTFIKANSGTKAAVALKAGESWKWSANNTVKVANTGCGISQIVNRGTFVSEGTATINVKDDLTPTPNWVNMPFENAEGATWNVTGGAKVNVQFDVTNKGTINIAANAQYRQDGQNINTVFTNDAQTLPQRFLASGVTEKVGKVINEGVFATVAASGKKADINNYGLIEHKSLSAKTYITTNEKVGAGFAGSFVAGSNMLGTINFPWSCKGAENVSISNALNEGFVSVTVDGEVSGALDASTVGSKVNYVIIKSGVTEINKVAGTVKYLEINEPGTEVAWKATETNSYEGLVVLSDINITEGTTVQVKQSCFLNADMYVGGAINNGTVGTLPSWNGYFGNTSTKFSTNYITY